MRTAWHYWRAKRLRAGKPLLQRLWFEAPWRSKPAEDGSDDEEGSSAPFMGCDDVKAFPRGRQLDPEEVEVKLRSIRCAARFCHAAPELLCTVKKSKSFCMWLTHGAAEPPTLCSWLTWGWARSRYVETVCEGWAVRSLFHMLHHHSMINK